MPCVVTVSNLQSDIRFCWGSPWCALSVGLLHFFFWKTGITDLRLQEKPENKLQQAQVLVEILSSRLPILVPAADLHEAAIIET